MGNQVCTLLLLKDNGEKTVVVVKRFVCYCGCSKILPTKSTSISAVRLSYTYTRTFALYGADTTKQDACYCEFYWAVNFVVHDTLTIPYLTVVRNTVAN